MRTIHGTTRASDGDWSGELTTEQRVIGLIGEREDVAPRAAAWTNLTHGTGHYVVGSDDHGLLGRGDALVTDQTGIALCIRTADCVPVFVTGRRSAAILHAGMAGAVQGILPHVVSVLATEYGESPDDLGVELGPHICATCYEVSEGNAMYLKGFPDAARFMRETDGKRTFDLPAQLADQAERLGIRRFQAAAACTFHEDGHFSARRGDGGKRILSYLMIVPDKDAADIASDA